MLTLRALYQPLGDTVKVNVEDGVEDISHKAHLIRGQLLELILIFNIAKF